ncbi:MAG: Lrp/AsnC family transcriptional regulator [Thermoprotei archaeon]|nr:MAG: Lrp/AsnC family transcriptional regulator [Thermoprotei archaeon]
MQAFVLIGTEVGAEKEVLEELKRIESVKEAYIVYGIYDLLAKVIVKDTEELKNIVSNKIRQIERVRSTLTMIVAEGFTR